jgi:hypothetical protein
MFREKEGVSAPAVFGLLVGSGHLYSGFSYIVAFCAFYLKTETGCL